VFVRSLLSQFEQYVQLGKKVPAEVLSSLNSIDEPGAWSTPWPRTWR
jgi:ATP-dependent Lon protease